MGTGRNLPLYASDVHLVAIDVSLGMVEVARNRAASLGRTVALRLGDAQELDLPASPSTPWSRHCRCAVSPTSGAVTEAVRVLRPGGRFVLLEHVASPNRLVRTGQRLLDPLSVRLQADQLYESPPTRSKMRPGPSRAAAQQGRGMVERLCARKPADIAPPTPVLVFDTSGGN